MELVLGTSAGTEIHGYRAAGWQQEGLSAFQARSAPAIGDFNGDGAEDLASVNFDQPEQIVFAWGAAKSPFDSFESVSVPGLTRPSQSLALQLDGVGREEVLIRGRDASSRTRLTAISVVAGNQVVKLWSQSLTRSLPLEWRTLDLDGDARDDLVFGPQINPFQRPGFLVYKNTGAGPFVPGQVGTMPPGLIAARDLDADGLRDGILIEDSTFLWYRGKGGGDFDEGIRYAEVDDNELPHFADFDEDGTLDAATPRKTSKTAVQIRFGNGDGTFREGERLEVGGHIYDFLLRDIDADGHTDLLLTSEDVQVAFGRGDGSFEAWRHYEGLEEEARMAFGDLDGDGREDLVLQGEVLRHPSTGARTYRIQPILIRDRSWTLEDSLVVPGPDDLNDRVPRLVLGDIAGGSGDEVVHLRWESGSLPVVVWRGFLQEERSLGPETQISHWSGDQQVLELAVADLDEDGREDLLVRGGGDTPNLLRTYKGNGQGSFQLIRRQPSLGSTYARAQMTEVDGDDRLDLGTGIHHTLQWARGDGAGGFEKNDLIWYGPSVDGLFADLDNDGRPDGIGKPLNPSAQPSWLVFNRNLGTRALADREAPTLDLRLLPVVDDDRVPALFDNGWRVQAISSDDCDARPRTEVRRLDLPRIVSGAPVFFRNGEIEEIHVWKDRGGSAVEVMLVGPEESSLRDLWARVLEAGGFALESNQIVTMQLFEDYGPGPAALGDEAYIPHSRRLVRRYVLKGERVVVAAVSEPDGDLVVRVTVSDRSGRETSASANLLEEKRRYCADASAADIVCRE